MNFKKTDWLRFKEVLGNKCDLELPKNSNLSNNEIDNSLRIIEKIIQNAIAEVVPKIKNKNSCESYINEEITKLQKHKSFLLT